MDNKLYGWISMRGVHYNPLGIEVCSTRSGTAPGDSRTTPHPPGQQARIGNSAAHLCGEVHALRTHCRGRHRGAPHPGVHNLSLPHSRSAMLHLDSAPSCARMWALPDSTRLATQKYRVLLPPTLCTWMSEYRPSIVALPGICSNPESHSPRRRRLR